MLMIVESDKSLKDICDAMEATVQKYKFGILGVHNLKDTMAKKGVPFERDCFIFEICNTNQAKKVLEAKMEISTALPCRVSVYEERGKVKIATIRPTEMLALYRSPELGSVAQEVEDTIAAIMREVAK